LGRFDPDLSPLATRRMVKGGGQWNGDRSLGEEGHTVPKPPKQEKPKGKDQ